MIGVLGLLRRFRQDRRGNALIEFALGFPILLSIGGYGIELSNLIITRMQINQITLSLADNASRIGVNTTQAVFQLREGDLNDILQGTRIMGKGLNLTKQGRITLSSLENMQQTFSDHASDTAPVQRLHWQRCIGLRGGPSDPGYDSSYGPATPLATAGTDSTYANRGLNSSGIGTNSTVTAPAGTGVIYVEVNYQYRPVFGTLFSTKVLIRSVATFIVRDKRDFGQIYNPQTALGTTPAPSTCNLYTA